jgi:hypothetical protein
MRTSILVIAVFAIGLISLTALRTGDEGPKVTICHIPPGNPENAHAITISINALPAHLAHGDSEGACDTQCTLETDPECFCDLFPDHAECN